MSEVLCSAIYLTEPLGAAAITDYASGLSTGTLTFNTPKYRQDKPRTCARIRYTLLSKDSMIRISYDSILSAPKRLETPSKQTWFETLWHRHGPRPR